jgi:hypothetical protein
MDEATEYGCASGSSFVVLVHIEGISGKNRKRC